jgi:transcriptional regulator with XRE-family HTH domain
MEESIKQIGERLRGLRDVLNIPAEEIAELCGISIEHYLKIEAGEADPSVIDYQKFQNVTELTWMFSFSEKSHA